jgi:hypothetical protein
MTKEELYLVNKIIELKAQNKNKILIQKLQQELDKLQTQQTTTTKNQ